MEDGCDADTVLILPLCGLKSAQHISIRYGSPVLVARGYFLFHIIDAAQRHKRRLLYPHLCLTTPQHLIR